MHTEEGVGWGLTMRREKWDVHWVIIGQWAVINGVGKEERGAIVLASNSGGEISHEIEGFVVRKE